MNASDSLASTENTVDLMGTLDRCIKLNPQEPEDCKDILTHKFLKLITPNNINNCIDYLSSSRSESSRVISSVLIKHLVDIGYQCPDNWINDTQEDSMYHQVSDLNMELHSSVNNLSTNLTNDSFDDGNNPPKKKSSTGIVIGLSIGFFLFLIIALVGISLSRNYGNHEKKSRK